MCSWLPGEARTFGAILSRTIVFHLVELTEEGSCRSVQVSVRSVRLDKEECLETLPYYPLHFVHAR